MANTFADRLKELRHAAGLAQPGLAAAAGIPVTVVRNYEQARRRPTWEAVCILANALGVPVEAFRGPAKRATPSKAAREARKQKLKYGKVVDLK